MVFISAFVAGVLAIFSPCVLPLVPILLLSAWQKSKGGPLALALGLNTTFIVFGLGFTQSKLNFGLPSEILSKIPLILLGFMALWLISDKVHFAILRMTQPLVTPLQSFTHRIAGEGIGGQFFLGILLGVVWTPCVGATLGYAIALASQGEHMTKAALIMLSYSSGIMIPLMIISYVSCYFVTEGEQKKTLKMARRAKIGLGWVLALWVILMITGYDKVMEEWVIKILPHPWLLWISK